MRQGLMRATWLGLLFATMLIGQTQGTIQGIVKDSSGAVIPGAAIAATNQATGVQYDSESNQTGFYSIPGLPPGVYALIAASDGFAPSERPNLRLEVGQVLRLDVSLNVGSVTEVVEVSAAAQLIQSERTEVGQVIDSKRILEMPLNGRNYLELARFSVGVLPSRELGKGTRQDGERGGEGGAMAVGMHAAQTNVLVDGADNSSRNSGGA